MTMPSPPSPVRIAGLQTSGTPGDPQANLAELERAAHEAASRGARLLITPEMFVTGYEIGDALPALARQELLRPASEIAARAGIGLVLGAPEHADGVVYNSAFFLDDHGRLLGRYRKTHLFGDLDRRSFAAGEDLVCLIDYEGLKIALLICYDVEFPETVRAAARAGAHLVVVPTAQMTPFDFVADHLIRVRAWENQVYVAYVNHDGSEGTLTYVGRSSIVSPSGEVLDSAGHGTRLLLADVSRDAVTQAQKANPYLADRRTDLYPASHREDRRP